MAIRFLSTTNTLPEIQINDTGNNPRLAFQESGVVSGGVSTTGGSLVLEASSGIERARILSTGQFGIGTTTPGAKLEVFNSGGTVFNVLGSLGQLFSVTDNLSGEIFAVADISGVPIMTVNSSGLSTFTDNVSLIANSAKNFRVTDGTQNIYVGSSSNTRFGQAAGASIIQSTGAAFGIGTQDGNNFFLGTNNTAVITMNTSSLTTFSGDIVVQGTGDSTFAGNVGIGETNPNSRLIIKNTSANDGIRIHTSDSAEGFLIFRDDTDTSPGAVVYDHSLDSLGFKVNNVSDRLIIKSTGQLTLSAYTGTGTTGTPTYVLGTDASGNVVKVLGSDIPGGGGTVTGTGVTNIIPYWTNGPGGVLGDSIVAQGSQRIQISSGGGSLLLGQWDGTNNRIESASRPLFITSYTSPIKLGISGSTTMTIESSKVGIGTTTPRSLLEIASNNPVINFKDTAAGTDLSYRYIQNVDGKFLFAKANDAYNSFTTHMTIDSNGNVGIGVVSPTERLQVFEGGLTAYKSYTNTNAGAILTSYQSVFSPFTKTTDLVAGSDGTVPSEIRFLTRTSGTSTIDERIRITSTGNVGIGTDSPNYKLEVQGVISSADAGLQKATFANVGNDLVLTANADATNVTAKMLFNSSGTGGAGVSTKMIIDGSGNVGIGTPTTSTYRFNVLKSNGNVGFFTDGTTADLAITCSSAVTMLAPSTALLAFGTSGSEKMRIIGNGNVGIGVTAPASTLHVLGPNGAGGGITLSSGTANNTQKVGRIKTSHYDNSEQPFTAILTNAQASSNILRLGGGSGAENAATDIRFYTAANNITLTGTENMHIASDGGIRFNAYGAGTLVTNANGQISVSSGGGADGPYLPLAGGTMTLTTSPLILPQEEANVFKIQFQGASSSSGISTVDQSGSGLFIGANSRVNNSGVVVTNDTLLPTAGIYFDGWSDDEIKFFTSATGNPVEALNINSSGNATFGGTISSGAITSTSSISGTFFTDGIVTWNGAQFNRPGAAIEFQFAGSTNSLVKFGANGSNPVAINANTGKVTGAATLAADGVSTLTTKSYVDGLVTGVPVYRGTWDARNNTERGSGSDGGDPDLRLAANKILGNYYIVETAGSATPNGAGTEPSSWNVGDWCIFSDVTSGAGTDLWQRIDNSSVISGAGTGQKVTKWAGAGPSETLTDGPITFSGNNSTFAGSAIASNIIINQITSATTNGNINIRNNAGTNIVVFNNNLSSTFAGDVIVKTALLSNQENTDVDTGTETIAQVAIATYTAAFFDFVVKKSTNVRSGTVYACHDGTNVQFTETSTQDLGDTSDVVLSVDISGGQMRLRATVASDNWSIKSLIRAI